MTDSTPDPYRESTEEKYTISELREAARRLDRTKAGPFWELRILLMFVGVAGGLFAGLVFFSNNGGQAIVEAKARLDEMQRQVVALERANADLLRAIEQTPIKCHWK